jgi:YesN/AraC family two-component response regulator
LSFSDYINKYRIDYAKSLMSIKNNPLTILEVSEQSGFANEVSFYRNFKKFTGTSPKKWHKQLLTSIQ